LKVVNLYWGCLCSTFLLVVVPIAGLKICVSWHSVIKGKKKSDKVQVWIVPGSQQVAAQVKAEGSIKYLKQQDLKIRQAGW